MKQTWKELKKIVQKGINDVDELPSVLQRTDPANAKIPG